MLSLRKKNPANYRGCEVINELQEIRDIRNKPKQELGTNKIVRIATILNLKTLKIL
jgi:hypothetical protein